MPERIQRQLLLTYKIPVRIQRRRTKAWKMPANTIYVGRPSRWGNPFTVQGYAENYMGYSVEHIADLVSVKHICVEAFEAWLTGKPHWAHGSELPSVPDISELSGKNLACWCPLHHPCHADVLLKLANQKE